MTRDKVNLRDAKLSDCARIFAWRNDPRLIAVSSSGETVDWDTHQDWFSRKVADPEEIFLVIQVQEDKEIGVIRLDREDHGVRRVNIYVDPDYFGKGIGPAALSMALENAFERDSELESIEAVVAVGNLRSQRMFEALGFRLSGKKSGSEFLAYRYVRTPC